MKGFSNSTKMRSGHHFSPKHGFTNSSGSTMQVKGYTRKVPKFADGGSVDSAVIKRTEPMTEFDKEYGGTGPLRPGFKKGGKIGPVKKGALHKALGVKQSSPLSMATLQSAKQSSSPLMRKRANFAINARKWNHKCEGGQMKYAGGGSVTPGKARSIAKNVLTEHVNYPAPRGHKGLGKALGFKKDPLIGS